MTSSTLARVWFGLTALAVLAGIGIQLPVTATAEDGFFSEPVHRALNLFAFFTIQSNLLVALSCVGLARDPDSDGPLRRVLRLTSVVAISVTGIVYHLVLADLYELSGPALLADTLVHTVVPVMAVLGWLVLGPRGRTSWRVVGLTIVFPVVWLAFTLVRGPLVGGFWPYPFVDVDELGLARVLVNCLVVALLFLGLAAGLHLLDRLLARGGTRTSDPQPRDQPASAP